MGIWGKGINVFTLRNVTFDILIFTFLISKIEAKSMNSDFIKNIYMLQIREPVFI